MLRAPFASGTAVAERTLDDAAKKPAKRRPPQWICSCCGSTGDRGRGESMLYDVGQSIEVADDAGTSVGEIMQQIADHKGCGTHGGSGKASCGSAAGSGDLAPEIWEKVKNHPCYSEEAHHHYARMHVAVAPACNIQCNYCNRKYDCANESRPGVVSEKLTPEQAAKKVLAVASTIPQMTVLGIAGPGDPLANPAKTSPRSTSITSRSPSTWSIPTSARGSIRGSSTGTGATPAGRLHSC
jgi:hypothetical protein